MLCSRMGIQRADEAKEGLLCLLFHDCLLLLELKGFSSSLGNRLLAQHTPLSRSCFSRQLRQNSTKRSLGTSAINSGRPLIENPKFIILY